LGLDQLGLLELCLRPCFYFTKTLFTGERKKYSSVTFVDISVMRKDFCMKFYVAGSSSQMDCRATFNFYRNTSTRRWRSSPSAWPPYMAV